MSNDFNPIQGMFEKSVFDAAHQVTLLSNGQFGERPSTPFTVTLKGKGVIQTRRRTVTHEYFSGGKENGRSLPQIYNFLRRNYAGARIVPLQRPRQKSK
jgi:hypothetical protein